MVDPALSASVNQLFINSSCSSGPHQGDPACPNAVLGDLRVRQAIQLSIDKQALVRGVLGDADQVAESLLPVGPYAPALVPAEFNPDKARQLLDQAGWSVGTDGIRTREGVRAQLSLLITAGGSISPAIAQLIQGNLQDVGIDTQIKEVPGAVLQGGFVGNSPLNLGAFDLVFASNTTPTDPQAYLHGHFASDQIPNPALQSGNNFSRIQDPDLDLALAAAGGTLDDRHIRPFQSESRPTSRPFRCSRRNRSMRARAMSKVGDLPT